MGPLPVAAGKFLWSYIILPALMAKGMSAVGNMADKKIAASSATLPVPTASPGLPIVRSSATSLTSTPKVPLGLRALSTGGKVARGLGGMALAASPYLLQGLGGLLGTVGKAAGTGVQVLSNIPKSASATGDTQRQLYGRAPSDLGANLLSGGGEVLGAGLSGAGDVTRSTLQGLGNTLQLRRLMSRLASDPTLTGAKANMMAHALSYGTTGLGLSR